MPISPRRVMVFKPSAILKQRINANGVDKTGPLSIPNTGGWQTWGTVRKTGVTLAAGPVQREHELAPQAFPERVDLLHVAARVVG